MAYNQNQFGQQKQQLLQPIGQQYPEPIAMGVPIASGYPQIGQPQFYPQQQQLYPQMPQQMQPMVINAPQVINPAPYQYNGYQYQPQPIAPQYQPYTAYPPPTSMASLNTSVPEAAGGKLLDEKPQPYVSKWQKLAQMLNDDEDGDPKKAPQVIGYPQFQQAALKPAKHISLIDADPATLTPDQRIQRDIEIQTKKLAEKQKEMLGFVAQKTVSSKKPGSIEEQIPLAMKGLPAGSYSIHQVQPNDTLDRVCLLYDVPKDAIRKANNFTGDEIYMKRELVIPGSAGPVFRNAGLTQTEEQRKQDMIELMSIHIKEKLKTLGSYQAEGKYYLEMHGYDYAKAIDEFEEDLKFENEQEQKFKGLKSGSRKNGMQPLLFLKK